MKTDESWIAEQARLLALEDGFGPAYVADGRGNAAAVKDDAEAASLRSSSA
jgi:hypothetical protein